MRHRGRLFPYNGNNYRSNYERQQAKRLDSLGVEFTYEERQIDFYDNVYNGHCGDCKSHNVFSLRSYRPDFFLPKSNLFVETKGRFTQEDRAKMKLVCDQSDEDIRIVFMRENYLTKKKKMSYSRWCEINNIQCAIGDIPEEWLKCEEK